MGATASTATATTTNPSIPPAPLSPTSASSTATNTSLTATATGNQLSVNASSFHIEIERDYRTLMSGHLMKRGFKNQKSSKNRYCILTDDGFFSYYNSKKNKIKGSANFGNAHQCISDVKDSCKFYVITSKRKWEFKTNNNNINQANKWIKSINSVINNKNISTPTANTSNTANTAFKFKKKSNYNNNIKEFDSDDDDNQSKSSYISKHRARRSVASVNSSIASSSLNLNNNNNNISFESWRISITNSLSDVLIEVKHRKSLNNYNINKYNDGYDNIAAILNNNIKLKQIFNKITNNMHEMTMKQYIASMSIIQKSRLEVSSVATQLLNDASTNTNTVIDDDNQSLISALSYYDDNKRIRMTPRISTATTSTNNTRQRSRFNSFR